MVILGMDATVNLAVSNKTFTNSKIKEEAINDCQAPQIVESDLINNNELDQNSTLNGPTKNIDQVSNDEVQADDFQAPKKFDIDPSNNSEFGQNSTIVSNDESTSKNVKTSKKLKVGSYQKLHDR